MGNAEDERERLSEEETLGPKEKSVFMEVRRGPDVWWTGKIDQRRRCTGRDGGRNRRDDLDVKGGSCSDGKRRGSGRRQRNKLTAE
jgi:hypothetical protein